MRSAADALDKHFLWVKTLSCRSWRRSIDLFPGYLLAAERHQQAVLVCTSCGQLNEVENRHAPGPRGGRGRDLVLEGPTRRGRCECPACGELNGYPDGDDGPPAHRMFAIEYHGSVATTWPKTGSQFYVPSHLEVQTTER